MSTDPRSSSSALPDLGGYRNLRRLGEAFWDAQKIRCAQENRFRRAPATKGLVDARGRVLYDMRVLLSSVRAHEALLRKFMRSCFRHVAPWAAKWAGRTRGVGEPTLARLLGMIGDPAVAEPYHWQDGKPPAGHRCAGHCAETKRGKKEKHLVADPPFLRSVSQLWSYCGVGDPSRKLKNGMDQAEAVRCGNRRARMVCFLLADAQMKTNGAYRPLYDEAKAAFAAEHPDASKGHCHNHALRIVAKEILRDLWLEARKDLGLGVARTEIM